MSLVMIYEEYNIINKDFLEFANKIAEESLENYSDEKLEKLKEYKEKFEEIMEKSSELVVSEENEINLNDLRYLVLDSLFLAADLSNFYHYKEVERFKMRIANYINKRRRAEFGI
ncbi:hypothetical protein [Clostridium sp.]|uniref:hypothetical protein n=1 Tax=Clostridium sp. TaxID=1506 RepID=UPI002A9201A3|nr:hypothetical protein [Clostridium sp.]MDY6012570.1 hypothetical protein [Clostridium sp.]